VDLFVATIGSFAGIVSAWFGYVAVRGKIRHTRDGAAGPAPASGRYDAFLSYATKDEEKAEWLARSLQARGRRVFLAKWIDIGLVEYAEKERALDEATNGILLFSHATMAQPEIRDDYAAILQRVHSGGRRFIPVLIDPVDLPPYARVRRPLDLTDPRNGDANLDSLARAIGA